MAIIHYEVFHRQKVVENFDGMISIKINEMVPVAFFV